MNPTLEMMLAIVKPENDRIMAEHKARTLEAENAKLRAKLEAMVVALRELEAFLDDHADVYDHGVPNDAMFYLTKVRAIIGMAEGRP